MFLAVGAVLFIGLVFLVKGCRNAQQKRAYKDYVREVGALVQESGQQSEGLFTLLRKPGGQGAVELQNTVNGFRVQAEQLVGRAAKADVPGEFARGQQSLLETLELRRDGLKAVARELPTALGDAGRREAAGRIAADMQLFLTSDVVYSQRVVPALESPLRDQQLTAEVEVPRSRFLPDIEWLRPATVATRIAGARGGGKAATPGLHGMALGNVTIGGQTLTAGTPAQISAGGDLAVTAQIQNGGESTEKDVRVKVSIAGGPKPIAAEKPIAQIAAGATQTVTIPLTGAPPKGKPATIKVAIVPVPGEQKTDNNQATYTATFAG